MPILIQFRASISELANSGWHVQMHALHTHTNWARDEEVYLATRARIKVIWAETVAVYKATFGSNDLDGLLGLRYTRGWKIKSLPYLEELSFNCDPLYDPPTSAAVFMINGKTVQYHVKLINIEFIE